MGELSETRYVSVGGADVAYRVAGDGPVDLLYFQGIGSHIELLRTVPRQIEFMNRFSSFSRLILFDRRGTGASDRLADHAYPTLEEWTDDLLAVLNAVESTRAAILAGIDAGPIAMLFAAMHPERVLGLLLLNTSARFLIADDYPIGASMAQVDALVDVIGATWGTRDFAQAFNPDMSGDTAFIENLISLARFSVTPREARAQFDYLLRTIDVRQALPLIQVPTRVLHVRDSPVLPIEHGRYLADHIPGAILIELPGASLSTTPNGDAVIEEASELLTGQRPPVEIDRVLATVLFTDIVNSTATAARLGDRRWKSVLDAHDRLGARVVERHGGRVVKTTGDGLLATFDGPARAVRCARRLCDELSSQGVAIRAGLHTGEIELRDEDVGGIAVHIGARVEAAAGPGEVLVSRTVKDLVAGSGIVFADRGSHQLKGVPEEWQLFEVTSA